MMLFFVAGLYFFARGIFALFGQTIFYTKRSLEQISEADLPAYLREIGIWNIITGVLFVGTAVLSRIFPASKILFGIFFILLLICVVFLSKCNEEYLKK